MTGFKYDNDAFYTPESLDADMGGSPFKQTTWEKWCREGKLKFRRIGRKQIIPGHEINRFFSEGEGDE